jgi:hypothetical protein
MLVWLNQVARVWALEESQSQNKMDTRHSGLSRGSANAYFHVVVTSFGQGLHLIPFKWSND